MNGLNYVQQRDLLETGWEGSAEGMEGAWRALFGRDSDLEATIASIADGAVLYDPAGRILRMNTAARGLLGGFTVDQPRTLEELVSRVRPETTDGRPFPLEETPLWQALRGKKAPGVVMGIRPPGAGLLWLSVGAAPIRSSDGRLLAVVASFADVTVLRELQQRSEDILHAVSHDLRSPLTAIQGFAQLLERQMKEVDRNARAQRSVEAIVANAKRMNAMIQDLVDSARLEAGQLKLNRRAMGLHSFVSDLRERLGAVLEVDRIRLEVPEDLPPVLVDPDRLERIFTNLLSNALKYSRSGTEVFLRAQSGDREVAVSVVDQGAGIAQEDIPHLFDRFYRAGSAGRTEGVGLGLFITRALVEAHGGLIFVVSQIEKGSAFTFTLPRAAGPGC